MAFGFEITGGDSAGSFKVVDTQLNMINLPILAQGAGSSVYATGSTNKPFIFVNAKGVSNQQYGIVATWNSSSKLISFYKVNVTYPSSTQVDLTLTAVSVNYFIVQRANEITASNQGYGLQVFTAAGAVAVDSQRYPVNSTYYMSELVPPNKNRFNFVDTLTSDQDAYVDLNYTLAHDGNGLVYYHLARFDSTEIVTQSAFIFYFGDFGTDFVQEKLPIGEVLIAKLR